MGSRKEIIEEAQEELQGEFLTKQIEEFILKMLD